MEAEGTVNTGQMLQTSNKIRTKKCLLKLEVWRLLVTFKKVSMKR